MEKLKRRNSQAELSLHSSQEDVKNTTYKRDIFGVFPDEPILSGIDKCLYFFGITDFNAIINNTPCDGSCRKTKPLPSVSESKPVISSEEPKIKPSCLKLKQSEHRDVGVTQAASADRLIVLKPPSSSTYLPKIEEKKKLYSTPCVESASSIQPRSSATASYIDVCPKSCLAMNFNLNSDEGTPIEKDQVTKKQDQRSNTFRICLRDRDTEYNTLKLRVKCRPKKKQNSINGAEQIDCDVMATPSMEIPEVTPKIMDTKWALTRVNFFDDFSRTYEVMNMKPNQPNNIDPEQTSVFFAVLPDGTAVCYDCLEH